MQKQAAAKYPKLQLLEPQYAGGTAQRAAQISGDLMAAIPISRPSSLSSSTTCPRRSGDRNRRQDRQRHRCRLLQPEHRPLHLKSGAFGFTVLWDPAQLGYLTVWVGKQLIDGKAFEAENTVPASPSRSPTMPQRASRRARMLPFFTAENVDKFDF